MKITTQRFGGVLLCSGVLGGGGEIREMLRGRQVVGQGLTPVRAGTVPCRRRSVQNLVPGGAGDKEMLWLLDILWV